MSKTPRQKPTLADIRRAVADYIGSEGCDCCEGADHTNHREALGRILRVRRFGDGTGRDFRLYRSKRK